MSSEMPTEAIRAFSDWLSEAFYWEEMRAFALTCRTAQETLQEELEWTAECDREDRETYDVEHEDFDAGRKQWNGRVNSDGESTYTTDSSEESSRVYTREELGDW